MEHPENDDQYKGLKVNKGIADVPTVNPSTGRGRCHYDPYGCQGLEAERTSLYAFADHDTERRKEGSIRRDPDLRQRDR